MRAPAPARRTGPGAPRAVRSVRVLLVLGGALALALASFGCDVGGGGGSGVGAAVLPGTRAAGARPAAARSHPAPKARTYPLTTDGRDRFYVAPIGERTTVRADALNVGSNTRMVWVTAGGEVSTDQQVCATWVAWTGLSQAGVALRVRGDGARVRAITVTGNIVWGARFGFNVHVWDTATHPKGTVPVTYAGGADLSRTFGPANGLMKLPWRICARVTGRMLDFKVWPVAKPEPRWGDTRYGRRFRLPASATYPGRPGWYAGHLRPVDQLVIEDQVTTARD